MKGIKQTKQTNQTNKENDPKDHQDHQGEDMDLEKVIERHEHLINSLAEFIKGKMNVHGEIRQHVTALGTSCRRLTMLLRKQNEAVTCRTDTATVETQTTPTRHESETTMWDTDSKGKDDAGRINTPKRRLPRRKKRKKIMSPGEETPMGKKLKGDEPTSGGPEIIKPTKDAEWQEVKKKKIKHQKTGRSNALIIRPKEKEKYAEILKKVKRDIPDEQARQCVDKIRRTATGDMLIVLTKENSEKALELQKAISETLGNEAAVISKTQEEDLEIKDIDETTTKEEVFDALLKAAGDNCKITMETIKSLRKAYGGTQTASIRLDTTISKKIIGEKGKIKIGWVNCRIRRSEKPTKCFKCWHYGHLASKCRNQIDRANLCVKCGRPGHKIADCTHDAHCILCKVNGNKENTDHIAGSNRCPVFKEAIQKVRYKR